jgi:L-xylulokinase
VFDTEGNEIKSTSVPSGRVPAVAEGWREQDMDQLWNGAVRAIQSLWDESLTPRMVIGVGVAGQGAGTFPVDEHCRPVRNGILSIDSRATRLVDRWRREGVIDELVKRTGRGIGAASSLTLAAWMKENEPENYKRVRYSLFSKDWIRYNLTGDIATDPTDGTGGPWFNLKEWRFQDEVYSLIGIDEYLEKRPPLRATLDIAGEITKKAAEQTGLIAGTPVATGSHDIAAFPFGVGSHDKTDMITVLGTFVFDVLRYDNFSDLPDGSGYCDMIPHRYLHNYGDMNSGSSLDRMLDLFWGKEKQDSVDSGMSAYHYLESMVDPDRMTILIFHPYFLGTREKAGSGAGYYGLRDYHTREDMIKAMFEGQVMGTYEGMRAMRDFKNSKRIWLIGGGAKSLINGQMLADISGLPVNIPTTLEMTCRGVSLGMLVALGFKSDFEAARVPVKIARTYYPDDKRHRIYSDKLGLFSRLNCDMTQTWHEMNEVYHKWSNTV